jgi:hypothetical protein
LVHRRVDDRSRDRQRRHHLKGQCLHHLGLHGAGSVRSVNSLRLLMCVSFNLPLDHGIRRTPLLFEIPRVGYVAENISKRDAVKQLDRPLWKQRSMSQDPRSRRC